MAQIVEAYQRFGIEHQSPRAGQFRCGQDVRQYLWDRYVVPVSDVEPRVPPIVSGADSIFSIPIIEDESLAPDAWQVRDQYGNVMREGVING